MAGTKAPTPTQIDEMLDAAQKLISAANREYRSVKLPCGSRALAFAVEAGFGLKMAYTVHETARYSGIDVKTLYEESKAGRLRMILPKGSNKGMRIAVDEMDRWMEENTL